MTLGAYHVVLCQICNSYGCSTDEFGHCLPLLFVNEMFDLKFRLLNVLNDIQSKV